MIDVDEAWHSEALGPGLKKKKTTTGKGNKSEQSEHTAPERWRGHTIY